MYKTLKRKELKKDVASSDDPYMQRESEPEENGRNFGSLPFPTSEPTALPWPLLGIPPVCWSVSIRVSSFSPSCLSLPAPVPCLWSLVSCLLCSSALLWSRNGCVPGFLHLPAGSPGSAISGYKDIAMEEWANFVHHILLQDDMSANFKSLMRRHS